MVERQRAGAARLGCLILLMLLGLAGYVTIVAGEVHLRAYRFRDSMAQQLRFAQNTSDAEIVSRLQARADSLNGVSVRSEYIDTLDPHLVQREVRFSPHAERAW